VTRSIHCAFNPAKNLQGVHGFWLRSANLCSLTLTVEPQTAACVMSVYLKVCEFECTAPTPDAWLVPSCPDMLKLDVHSLAQRATTASWCLVSLSVVAFFCTRT
jgi:hypothetical protein